MKCTDKKNQMKSTFVHICVYLLKKNLGSCHFIICVNTSSLPSLQKGASFSSLSVIVWWIPCLVDSLFIFLKHAPDYFNREEEERDRLTEVNGVL